MTRMIVFVAVMNIVTVSLAELPDLPTVQVSSVRRIFHNGEHNAFTDLCRYKGYFFLTFRSCPDGHGVYPTSSIIVLRSRDTKRWEQVLQFRVPKRDTRDPHFLVFQDKLFIYTGTWYCGETAPIQRDMNEHLGYAVWTADAEKWTEPIMLEGTYGHYIWRAVVYKDKVYLCGRRNKEFVKDSSAKIRQGVLLASDDGLNWKTHAIMRDENGNETAFYVEQDGTMLALARGGGRLNALICRAKPPFKEWKCKELDRYIGGPLLTKWGQHYLVGGRKTVTGKPVTSLYWLVNDHVHKLADLPSAGDNSYPGFIELNPTQAVVSYYSTHEKDSNGKSITAIYLAELKQLKSNQ